MNKHRYCGISRMPFATRSRVQQRTRNLFVESLGEPGEFLGDKIVKAAKYGADLGVTVSVNFDENVVDGGDAHEVDVLASPNMDFFDIVEQTGRMADAPTPYVEPSDGANE